MAGLRLLCGRGQWVRCQVMAYSRATVWVRHLVSVIQDERPVRIKAAGPQGRWLRRCAGAPCTPCTPCTTSSRRTTSASLELLHCCFSGPSRLGRQCSGCSRSLRRGDPTLTATQPTFSQAGSEAFKVSEAMSSGHQRCHLVGQRLTTAPCDLSRLDPTGCGRRKAQINHLKAVVACEHATTAGTA